MPVIHVRGGAQTQGSGTDRSLASIATAAAAAAGEPVERVWCTYSRVSKMTVGERPNGGIVYVDVLMRSRGEDVDRATLEAAGRAASQAFGVPQHDVWARLVILEPHHVFAG